MGIGQAGWLGVEAFCCNAIPFALWPVARGAIDLLNLDTGFSRFMIPGKGVGQTIEFSRGLHMHIFCISMVIDRLCTTAACNHQQSAEQQQNE